MIMSSNERGHVFVYIYSVGSVKEGALWKEKRKETAPYDVYSEIVNS